MVKKDLSKKKGRIGFMDTCRIFFVKATMKNNCVKIHRSTQNKISKLYLIGRFARKVTKNWK